MAIVLASASPRRRQLLEMLGVKDLQILPAQSEEKAPGVTDPAALVQALSAAKAREVTDGDGVVGVSDLTNLIDLILANN